MNLYLIPFIMKSWTTKLKGVNNKTQLLTEIYEREVHPRKENRCEGDSEESLDLYNLVTRSQGKYPTHPASTMARSDSSQGMSPVTTTPLTIPTNSMTVTSAPIKVLPTSASIRQYSGQEPDYSAIEFLSLCEDVMKGSSVTTAEDKNGICSF